MALAVPEDTAGIRLAYERLCAADAIVAKALRVSELAKMAKLELRTRQLLDKQWNVLAKQATARATSMAQKGKKSKAIDKAVAQIMGKWAKVVTPPFNKNAEEVYKLARQVGHKKATKQIKASLAFDTPNLSEQEGVETKKAKAQALGAFDVADAEAIAVLAENNTFWIGEHYDANLSASIATTTSETIAQAGASRVAAATLMAQRVEAALGSIATPGGFHGTSLQYFEGLTANAMTVGRTFGQLRSFSDIGITRYQIVNPSDSRTCKVCAHMDGKVFTTEQGNAQMAADLAAEEPDDIKASHPWLSFSALLGVSGAPGQITGAAGTKDSAALAAAGLALPSYHFRCRCTVDIDEAVGSFSALA